MGEAIVIAKLITVVVLSMVATPDLSGLATHYDCPPFCGNTASGEPYDAWAWAGAVDCKLYPELAGECLLVRSDGPSALPWIFITVNDCGYLADVGVAIDFPEATFWLLSPQAEDGHLAGVYPVDAWVVPKVFCPAVDAEWWKVIGGEDGRERD